MKRKTKAHLKRLRLRNNARVHRKDVLDRLRFRRARLMLAIDGIDREIMTVLGE